MASDLESALREIGTSLAGYVKDAASMTVESRYVHVTIDQDADFAQSKALAHTEIHLDGDSKMIFPLRQGEDGYLEATGRILETAAVIRDGIEGIEPEVLRQNYLVRPKPCYRCPLSCGRETVRRWKSGRCT